jgi:hypothetical protein
MVSNGVKSFYVLSEFLKGFTMPKSKKPKVKRPGANPTQKPAWYQALNGPAAQHVERPSKKSKNKLAQGS